MEQIDIVFSYVNKNDLIWQQAHEQIIAVEPKIVEPLYRDWGLLKYFLRGIAKNMPYINKVYMVVSNIEQVPEWVNTSQVQIVLHKDIIPEKYLPVFNSVTIEFFLYDIPGLAEHFVYFNDDMYALNYINPNLLFNGGKPCCIMERKSIYADSMMNKIIWPRINNLLFTKFKRPNWLNADECLAPPHGPVALCKSTYKQLWSDFTDEITKSLGQIRNYKKDLTPNILSVYQYLTNNMIALYPNFKYLNGKTTFNYNYFLINPTLEYVCINDEYWSDEGFKYMQKILPEIFEEKFPEKCKYEK